MIGYILGLAGLWLITDAVFSIIVTIRFNPQKVNSWKYDHSIRIIRCGVGIWLIILGGQLLYGG